MLKKLSYRYGSDLPWAIGGIMLFVGIIAASIVAAIITGDAGYYLIATILTVITVSWLA